MSQDSYKFGLKDCKVAPWTSTGSYGTLVDVPAINMMSADTKTTNAELPGDDAIVDVHAKNISGNVSIKFGFKDLAVLEVLTGKTILAGANYDALVISNDNFPYFGICGHVDDTQGGANNMLFVAKCKILEGIKFSMQYGQYWTPEMACECVPDGQYGIFIPIAWDTQVPITAFPPFPIAA